MTLLFCWDTSPADWIVDGDLPWQQLVGFGPAGFDAYARLRFLPDPIRRGESENDVRADWRIDQLPRLFEVMATHTTTTDDCYFCVWEGFGPPERAADEDAVYIKDDKGATPRIGAQPGVAPQRAATPAPPHAPQVTLPNRACWLFRGPLADAGTWDTAAGLPGWLRLGSAESALVWPADHAWCVARDVDAHWAGIGAPALLIDELVADPHLDVIPTDPTQSQPSYQ